MRWSRPSEKVPQALGIEADVNFSGFSRIASFTVTDGSKSAEVTVVQQFSNECFLASAEYGRRRLLHLRGPYVRR